MALKYDAYVEASRAKYMAIAPGVTRQELLDQNISEDDIDIMLEEGMTYEDIMQDHLLN